LIEALYTAQHHSLLKEIAHAGLPPLIISALMIWGLAHWMNINPNKP